MSFIYDWLVYYWLRQKIKKLLFKPNIQSTLGSHWMSVSGDFTSRKMITKSIIFRIEVMAAFFFDYSTFSSTDSHTFASPCYCTQMYRYMCKRKIRVPKGIRALNSLYDREDRKISNKINTIKPLRMNEYYVWKLLPQKGNWNILKLEHVCLNKHW